MTRRPHTLLALTWLCLAGCGEQAMDVPSPAQSTAAALSTPKLRKHAPDIRVPGRYIVVLKEPEAGRPAGSVPERSRALLQRFGGTLRHQYSAALPGYAVELTEAQAARLAASEDVEYVEESVRIIGGAVQSISNYHLDRLDQRAWAPDNRYEYSWTGAGVHAYVLDTGIRTRHQEFGGRARGYRDYVGGDEYDSNDDCHGHGTHVAALLGGATYGVAKGVTIHSARVLDCNNEGNIDDTLAALDAVIADHQSPALVNLSAYVQTVYTPLDAAVRRVVAAGIPVVTIAGNLNADACTTSPAQAREAIVVGATDSADRRAEFPTPGHASNFGDCVDLFAPGSNVESASNLSDTGTTRRSGTSMSAPLVAGAVAHILQLDPGASPAAIQTRLIGEATRGLIPNPGTGSPNRILFTNVKPPGAPGGVSVSVRSPSQLNLSWTAPATDIASYRVYRNGTYAGASATTSYVDSGLISASDYGYGIAAVNHYGQQGPVSGQVTGTTPVDPAGAAPLWRYWNPGIGDHLYTMQRDDAGLAPYGYSLDGVEARAYTWQARGTVPLWRYWNPGVGNHFYTVQRDDVTLAAYGYTLERIEAYVFTYPAWGTVPLHRYYSGGFTDHLYTVDRNDAYYGPMSWTYERIEAYVYPR